MEKEGGRMLVGGFYQIDLALTEHVPRQETFSLRCDEAHNYRRKIYTTMQTPQYALKNGIARKGDVVLAPDYLCISVLNSLEVADLEFRFYHIREDLTIDLEDLEKKLDEKVKILYVIHYFGIPQPLRTVEAIKRMRGRQSFWIIEDLTQALYTWDTGRIGFGDYLVASTRKWLPVTDGGLLAVREGVPLEEVPMEDGYDEAAYRQLLISVAREKISKTDVEEIEAYLDLERQANGARYLDFTPKKMTEATRRILFQYDHQGLAERRRENYRKLYAELSGVRGLSVLSGPLDPEGKYVPFGFVVLVKRREDFYWYLARRGVIGEIQWRLPTDYYQPGEAAWYLSEHNLMLFCDHRYGEAEMNYVIETVKDYFNGR
ncbi:MAG: DegT/DnrJ/EryC1/StrS family aminotransferase [Blautia sp.]